MLQLLPVRPSERRKFVHFGKFIFHSKLTHSINSITHKDSYSILWRNSSSVNRCLEQQIIQIKQQKYGFYAKKGILSFYLKPITNNYSSKLLHNAYKDIIKKEVNTETKRAKKDLHSNMKIFLFSIKLNSSFASRGIDIPETAFSLLPYIIGDSLPLYLYQDVRILIGKKEFNARLDHLHFTNSTRDCFRIRWQRNSGIKKIFHNIISSGHYQEVYVYGITKESKFVLEPLSKTLIKTNKQNSDNTELITLTHGLIEKARTPNGGFTKSQLAAIGIGWPPPEDWIEKKVGTKITKEQLEVFNKIEYTRQSTKLRISKISDSTYKNVTKNTVERQQMIAILQVMLRFEVPATVYDIARTISRSSWGENTLNLQVVESLLKRLPEVALVNNNKYILKSRLDNKDKTEDNNKRIKLSLSNGRIEILSHYEALKRVVLLVGLQKVHTLGICIKNNPLLQKLKTNDLIRYEKIAIDWWLNSELDTRHCFNSIKIILNHYNVGIKAELV